MAPIPKFPTSALAAALAAAMLAGCAPRRTPPSLVQQFGIHVVEPTVEEVKLPALGVTADASVGSSMVSSSKVTVVQVIELSSPLRVSRAYQHDQSWTYEFTIPPGTYRLSTKDRVGGAYYTFGRQPVGWITGGKWSHNETAVADLKFTPYGTLEFIWAIPGSGEFFTVPLDGLKIAQQVKHEPARDGFRRELIYTGRSGSTVTLMYREFLNDLARPAFSQQLQYDIGSDPLIGYKGARFEVLKADNTKISYRVLSQLE